MAVTSKDLYDELREDVRAFPIFGEIGEEGLDALCRMARCHDYPKGNILHYRGDPANNVFMVIRGEVKIILASSDGRQVAVDLLYPGALFGLVSAVDGGSHPAHAVTATDARLAKFGRESFLEWMERERTTRTVVLHELARRVRQAYQRIGEHALLGVKERLRYALLEIAGREGQPDPEGDDIIFTRPTHEELAQRIGSSREVVTRVLKELLEDEMVSAEGRVVRVPLSALVLTET